MISYISSKNYTNLGIEKRGLVIPILQAYDNLRKNEYDSVLDFELVKQKFIDGDYERFLKYSEHKSKNLLEMASMRFRHLFKNQSAKL